MKNNHKTLTFISFLVITAALMACSPRQAVDSGKIAVTVSILPQKYFVERIAGDLVDVNVMVGPGEEPHTFEPQPSQMEALSNSQIYFTIGVEFEDAWLAKFKNANPEMKFVDTSAGIEKVALLESPSNQSATTSNHEGELDPHIWLSPANVKVIARTITDTLSSNDPQNSSVYQNNLESFLTDIDNLDQEIRNSLDTLSTRQFITFHPAWGYFARDYDLEQIAIEVGGNEPSASELANLVSYAKENDIHFIFAAPEFSTKSAETIANEINGQVILIDPLAEDWLENMKNIAQSLSNTLQ